MLDPEVLKIKIGIGKSEITGIKWSRKYTDN